MFTNRSHSEKQSSVPSPSTTVTIALALYCFSLSAQAAFTPVSWTHLSSANGDLPVPFDADQQTATLIVDVDKDGAEDFVLTERTKSPSVVLYRRQGDGWKRLIVDNTPLRVEAGGAVIDIDGDGDLDILFGGDSKSNEVWWWENPYPKFDPETPWKRRLIKQRGANKHHDEMVGDFDGDGRDELVFWNQKGARSLFRAEIPKDPKATEPWPYKVIYKWDGEQRPECEGLAQADIDGDGVTDIIGGGSWFKHKGNGAFAAHVIDPDPKRRFTRSAAGQLVEGGRPEVILSPGDADGPLTLYEWKNGKFVGRDLVKMVYHGHSLQVADVNDDGHLDIFSAEMGRVGRTEESPQPKMRVLLGDGKGKFVDTVISTGYGNHESRLGDLDGDGDLDILAKPYNWEAPRVDVWMNNLKQPTPIKGWARRLIESELPHRSVYVDAADINGDGREDIVVGAWWYANPGSLEADWDRQAIGAPLNNMAQLHDFDGDGDIDILGTQGVGADANVDFVWAQNDGKGAFTIFSNIDKAQGDFLQGVAVARFQPNGPLEVALSWHKGGEGVQAFTVPRDPSKGQWTLRHISRTGLDEDLSIGDIDRDGDLDLLLGTMWLENPRDGHAEWPGHEIGKVTMGTPDRNDLIDVNGDGRLDAVVGLEKGTDILLFVAPEDPKKPWSRRIIGAGVGGGFSMDSGDFDGDGDPDVVLGEHRGKPNHNRTIFYENRSNGVDWLARVIDSGVPTEIDHHDASRIVDIDGDGDQDVVTIGWYNPRVWVIENRN